MFNYDTYRSVRETVSQIATECGRDAESVMILPVSKTVTSSVMKQAVSCGITIFGENRVQEAESKYNELGQNVQLHMIGHLQSNKAAQAVSVFDLIHSIDKASTAQKLDKAAASCGKIQRILVQVNTSSEETKNGINPGELPALCQTIDTLEHLFIEGLMTIGPMSSNQETIRSCFSQLRHLRDDISKLLNRNLPHLSMGMSNDFQIAIEEGATIVRIGSLLFGERHY